MLVVAIVSLRNRPIKRLISDARDRTQLVDATYGRLTRAVIVTSFGHVVLSAIQPETVAQRFVHQKEDVTMIALKGALEKALNSA